VRWPKELEWWEKNDFWCPPSECLEDMQREATLCIAIALAENKVDAISTVEATWFLMSYAFKADLRSKALLTRWFPKEWLSEPWLKAEEYIS